jgi:hypothetical protein
MDDDREHKPSITFHLRLVSKIAASIAAISGIGLALVVALLIDDRAGSYRQFIATYGFARENLASALLLFGLVMVVVSATVTWLVTLYASFSFAGPIYRFCRNLELVTARGPVPPVPLRGSDRLQQQCSNFSRAVANLREHYSDLRVLTGQIEQAATKSAIEPGAVRQLIGRLKETGQRVRL